MNVGLQDTLSFATTLSFPIHSLPHEASTLIPFFLAAPGVLLSSTFFSFFIMPQDYRAVPLEEQSQSSRDDGSVNEKFEWRSEKTTLSQRIRTASTSHLAWIVQAVLLSASITFFALGVCMRTAKQADTIPMTFCKVTLRVRNHSANR